MQDPVIINALSRDRLDGFKVKGGPNWDSRLFGRYLHNLALSNAFYPYFHALEVLLRNRIHSALSVAHNIDPARPDLYLQFPCWLDATSSFLVTDHRGIVAVAKANVIKDLRKRFGPTEAAKRHLYTPGRLVAQLTFSFWVFLFDDEYSSHGRDQGILWPRYFPEVFPHKPLGHGVVILRQELRRLLVVRNRIMHFERIAPWSYASARDGALDPERIRGDVLRLLDWMEPSMSQAMRKHLSNEPFEKVYRRHLDWLAIRMLMPSKPQKKP